MYTYSRNCILCNVDNRIYYLYFEIHAVCDLFDGCNPLYCQHTVVYRVTAPTTDVTHSELVACLHDV